MKRLAFIVILTIAGTDALAAVPQQVIEISGPPECSEQCLSVTVTQVIESPPEVGFGRDDILRAAVTRSGDVVIAPRNWTGTILRFRDGAQIGRFSQFGEGPGESKGIRALAVGIGDSVHAFGAMTRNVFNLEGTDFRTQSDEFFPATSNLVYEGGEVHVAMVLPRLSVEEAKLIVMDRGDRDLGHARELETSVRGGSTGTAFILDQTASNCLAVGYRGRYLIDVFDSSQQLVRTVRRTVPWFSAWDEWIPPTDGPSDTRMMAVVLDCEAQLLWVQMLVAEDENFEPYPFSRSRELLDRESRTHDTLIEVISLDGATVVASQRFEGTLGPLQLGGHLLEPFISDSGEQGYRVLRLTLPEA
jgi:hypothetical protein